MLFVSRRNQSEPVSQTFSTSRRRFTNCAGKWPRGAAADLSRLTGRRADRLRANEPQAEARLPRLVLVRLRLQIQLRLQLSCPPPPRSQACLTFSTPRRSPDVSQQDLLPLRFSCLANLQLYDPLPDTLCLRFCKPDTPLPFPFCDGFPPASFLKTFRTEGS